MLPACAIAGSLAGFTGAGSKPHRNPDLSGRPEATLGGWCQFRV